MLLESASQDERLRLEELAKRTNFQTIYTDKLRYDRHKEAYGHRVRDFPESYSLSESHYEYILDPDFKKKMRY